MLTAFERTVAFRYLRARREEGLISVIAFFSLIGITLGVATLIVVLAVMNGVRDELVKSIIGLEGHVSVYTYGTGVEGYDQLSKTLGNLPHVQSAVPKIEGQVMASYKGKASGAMAVAFRPEDLDKKELLVSRITQGNLDAVKQGEGIVIGSRMAERMGLKLGDEILLISPEGRATVAGLMPRVKAYPVTGIFSIGMFSYDNGLVVMPFKEAQVYFKLNQVTERVMISDPQSGGVVDPPMTREADLASAIEIVADSADQAQNIAKSATGILGGGYRVYDWKTSNSQIFQAVIVQRNVMFLILMLIILVASFNIISSLIMLVREKGSDVAILRTMGVSRASVMKIFFTCGASVGVIGTVFGVALGLVIAFNTENIQLWLESMMGHKLFADELYFLSHLPSKVDMREVAAVVAMSLALSFLATLYPARKAAKLDPAEALRYG
jgi:lipoprotein-releasing system permease protein